MKLLSPPSPEFNERLSELRETSVSELMIPRALIVGIDADVQLRRLRKLKLSPVEFFPVYRGDLDNVLGWVPKSAFVSLINKPNMGEEPRIVEFMRPVIEVGINTKVADLADHFLAAKVPFLVIKDQTGKATLGLVTLTDFVGYVFGVEHVKESGSATDSLFSHDV